jgi:hypothetical protein
MSVPLPGIIFCRSSAIFREEQKGELLNIVLVREAVIAQDIAVVPELLNDSVRCTHCGTPLPIAKPREVPVLPSPYHGTQLESLCRCRIFRVVRDAVQYSIYLAK